MGLDLYVMYGSGPCRTVLLTAKALGVNLNVIELDLMKGEHLTPEFIKINPQHTIPTLVDNGFALWESRAIITYLVNKYSKTSKALYPEDPQTRALIDQRLYFDAGPLSSSFSEYFYPQFLKGAPADPEKRVAVEKNLEFLNQFLEGHSMLVGDALTLADLTIVVTVSNIELAGVDISKFPNVNRWYQKTKTIVPGYQEINQKGVDLIKEYMDKTKQ